MRRLADGVRVLQHASAIGIADYAAIFTLKTWTLGWLMRMSAEMVFYALIGKLLESQTTVEFLLIGNLTLLAASSAYFAVQSSVWERRAGTLPLLIAAPAPLFLTFAGRSVQWIGEGVLTAAGAMLIVGPMFDVGPGWNTPAVIGLFVLIAAASYGMGLFLGGVVLRFPEARNVWFNVTVGVMAIVCGVNVTVEFFPLWVQGFAQAFPLTHGLEAVRSVAGDGGPIVVPMARCLVVGAGWYVLAAATLRLFAEQGRRTGSIDFEV